MGADTGGEVDQAESWLKMEHLLSISHAPTPVSIVTADIPVNYDRLIR
jgi:hypothetical protein